MLDEAFGFVPTGEREFFIALDVADGTPIGLLITVFFGFVLDKSDDKRNDVGF